MFQTFFYQPIFNLLIWLYNIVPGHDLGLAIIALTVIIKLILLPLTKQQIKSQKALQDLQPKIDELKKKYKDKKEAMGRAMMELYKKNKVNPFSSCLPLLVQLPFLWAVFRVFRDGLNGESLNLVYSFINRPETLNSVSFGILDLSNPNVVLAVLAGAAQFWQVKMMSTKRPEVKSKGARDENMMAIMNKQMLYFMPALTFFICLQFSSGLALYWLTTTILTVFQQMYMFKDKKVVADLSQGGNKKAIEGEVVKINPQIKSRSVIEEELVKINPQILEGIWNKGFALDKHTISSIKLENGKYKNEYSKMGDYIHKIKYNYNKTLIPEIGKTVADFIKGKYKNMTNDEDPYPILQGIICIPPSNKNRPFQPVIEIAREVCNNIHIPILENCLEKIKETPTMKGLSKEESQKLLKGAFEVRNIDLFTGKNILLFDDLYGTGTTLTEITKIIQKNTKVKNIFVLTITKTRTSSGMRDNYF